MTEKQKIDLLYFLDVYKDDLIINMTDKNYMTTRGKSRILIYLINILG